MRILHILDRSVPLHSGYSFRTLCDAGSTNASWAGKRHTSVFAFQPNTVFYCGHSSEERILIASLSRVVKQGISLPRTRRRTRPHDTGDACNPDALIG